MFRHLKLEIVLAMPVLNKWKIEIIQQDTG